MEVTYNLLVSMRGIASDGNWPASLSAIKKKSLYNNSQRDVQSSRAYIPKA